MELMAKRQHVEMPSDLQPDENDDDLTKYLINTFDKVWNEALWGAALSSGDVTVDQLRNMKNILELKGLTSDQVALQLFETFAKVERYEAHIKRCTLVMKFCKAKFIEGYKNHNKPDILGLVNRVIGGRGADVVM